jgi:hypothetical protein
MSTTTTPVKAEKVKASPAENQKGIENHKEIAAHLQEASKHHLDAAKHHEEGNHEKAAESTVKAQGHTSLAHEGQKEDAKHHALKS